MENVIAGVDCGAFAGRVQVDRRIVWMKLAALAEGAALASERLWQDGAKAGERERPPLSDSRQPPRAAGGTRTLPLSDFPLPRFSRKAVWFFAPWCRWTAPPSSRRRANRRSGRKKYAFFPTGLTKEKQGIYYLLEIRLYEFN